jgi:hypothetical protein
LADDPGVESRAMVGALPEQIRPFSVPAFHCFDGGGVLEGALGDVLVVEADVAREGLAQVFARAEAGGVEDLG